MNNPKSVVDMKCTSDNDAMHLLNYLKDTKQFNIDMSVTAKNDTIHLKETVKQFNIDMTTTAKNDAIQSMNYSKETGQYRTFGQNN